MRKYNLVSIVFFSRLRSNGNAIYFLWLEEIRNFFFHFTKIFFFFSIKEEQLCGIRRVRSGGKTMTTTTLRINTYEIQTFIFFHLFGFFGRFFCISNTFMNFFFHLFFFLVEKMFSLTIQTLE